jgi:hypothetical protein
MTILDLPLETITHMLACISEVVIPPKISVNHSISFVANSQQALELLERKQHTNEVLPTQLRALDEILNGGLHCGTITEVNPFLSLPLLTFNS